jgi:hypothetical protein
MRQKITTRLVLDMNTGDILVHEFYFYDGDIAQAKKGREQQAQVAQGQLDQMKTDAATRAKQLASVEPLLTNLTSSVVGPNGEPVGSLSPLAEAQYGSDSRNIAKTYGDIRRNGLRAIGIRGFANAPSGMMASVINTAGQNQGVDETNAYEHALQQTYGQGLEAAKMRLGLISTYDPTQAANSASTAAFRQSQMGSLAGDIGQGLSTAAGLATTGMGLAKMA